MSELNQTDLTIQQLDLFESEFSSVIAPLADEQAIRAAQAQFLGKKGKLADAMKVLGKLPPGDRPRVGAVANRIKATIENEVARRLGELVEVAAQADLLRSVDVTLPARPVPAGRLHLLSQVRLEMVQLFAEIGFVVAEGPQIETDWHNFEALALPKDHPARDMQDTFFVKGADGTSGSDGMALRTHTSSVQVRVMEGQQPPIRTISPGRVYRNEAISARAHCMFHQVEALYVDKGVSFSDLKGTLDHFTKSLFGPEVSIRMRPSYFPFTEPSAEVDMSCTVCGGTGCNLCKHSGWVEIMGCGMVDPAVLANCDIDPEMYSGFALGMGVERITQLIYRVPDLRMYWENDVRFLDQFTAGTFRS